MPGLLGKIITSAQKVGYKKVGLVLLGGAATAAADHSNDNHEAYAPRRDDNNYISYISQPDQHYDHKQPQHVCQLSASIILYRLTPFKKLFGFGSLFYAFHIYEKWDKFSKKSEDSNDTEKNASNTLSSVAQLAQNIVNTFVSVEQLTPESVHNLTTQIKNISEAYHSFQKSININNSSEESIALHIAKLYSPIAFYQKLKLQTILSKIQSKKQDSGISLHNTICTLSKSYPSVNHSPQQQDTDLIKFKQSLDQLLKYQILFYELEKLQGSKSSDFDHIVEELQTQIDARTEECHTTLCLTGNLLDILESYNQYIIANIPLLSEPTTDDVLLMTI